MSATCRVRMFMNSALPGDVLGSRARIIPPRAGSVRGARLDVALDALPAVAFGRGDLDTVQQRRRVAHDRAHRAHEPVAGGQLEVEPQVVADLERLPALDEHPVRADVE